MPSFNSEHLLEQADMLVAVSAGRPRQANIRRAVSAAYYSVFHAVLTAAADHFVGATKSTTVAYGLAYRSIDHRWLRELCTDLQKSTLPAKLRPHEPIAGFGPDIITFAEAVEDLQQKRYTADYDPLVSMSRSEAILAIKTARGALARFNNASQESREGFLGLLLFRPR